MGAFDEYTPVRIASDRFTAEGVPRGSVGYIIEIHEQGVFEVEISNGDTGETIAVVTARRAELETVAEG